MTLVLLVIFIGTVPLFHQTVLVDLPEVDSATLEDKFKFNQEALAVDGQSFVDGVVTRRQVLGTTLF